MGENNFYSLVAEGNKSEQLVADWLTNKGWTVVNVTGDKKHQDLEIDLIATKGNEVRTIEVKRENRCADTGNLSLETVTNTRTKNKGWFKKTQADFICWHDTQNNKLLFSLTSALQEIIKQPYVLGFCSLDEICSVVCSREFESLALHSPENTKKLQEMMVNSKN